MSFVAITWLQPFGSAAIASWFLDVILLPKGDSDGGLWWVTVALRPGLETEVLVDLLVSSPPQDPS